MRAGRINVLALSIIVGLGALGVAAKAVDDRYPWAWAYLVDHMPARPVEAAAGPTHVMFTFVDHFEPHEQAAMDQWMRDYPGMASRYQDADGRHPQHSWFWYFSHSDADEALQFLQQLAHLTYDGFGEVELHLHHFNDTERTFLKQITKALQLSNWTGAMLTADAAPRTSFGFIHGLWSLDNSRGSGACGVNNEITLLRRLGCYADFTHPSWGPMHPRTINRFYYVTDDPQRPKSYDTGVPMRVGGAPTGDLLIFEGPSVVRWRGWRPVYDHGDVTMTDQPTPERIDAWVKTGVHVPGRPEWVFVKIFTHGAVADDHEAVLGAQVARMHAYLGEHYNDGQRFVLHYVTAREAYNIARAAEAGHNGNPNAYRNFIIPPPANRLMTVSVPYDLISSSPARVVLRLLAPAGTAVTMRVHAPDVKVIGDAMQITTQAEPGGSRVTLTTQGEGLIELSLRPTAFAQRSP